MYKKTNGKMILSLVLALALTMTAFASLTAFADTATGNWEYDAIFSIGAITEAVLGDTITVTFTQDGSSEGDKAQIQVCASNPEWVQLDADYSLALDATSFTITLTEEQAATINASAQLFVKGKYLVVDDYSYTSAASSDTDTTTETDPANGDLIATLVCDESGWIKHTIGTVDFSNYTDVSFEMTCTETQYGFNKFYINDTEYWLNGNRTTLSGTLDGKDTSFSFANVAGQSGVEFAYEGNPTVTINFYGTRTGADTDTETETETETDTDTQTESESEIINGYYYVNGEKVLSAGVVNVDGDLYYIGMRGQVFTGTVYVTEAKSNGLVQSGTCVFDADGKLVIENGAAVVDGRYYVDGVLTKNAGVIQYAGSYYYIGMRGQAFIGTVYVTEAKANGLLEAGKYTFDADGLAIS